jgi:signal transduction histidine kinase
MTDTEISKMIDAPKCREALDTIPFEVYAIDLQSDEIVYANQAFLDAKGKLSAAPCYTVINGRKSRCPFCKREELLDEQNRPNGKTFVYDFFNELQEKWYQIQEKAVIWDDGALVRYVIAVDISKLKETQNRLAEAHAQLAIKNKELEINQIQQAKQAQLGELLDLTAHQWKQPLSAISILFGELKILQTTKALDDESVLQICTEGRNAIENMSAMLDSFRSFFSPSTERVDFDTIETIGKIYELVKKKLSFENIVVELPLDTKPLFVNGAPNEFAQVVLALFANSWEAIGAKRQKEGLGYTEYVGKLKISVEKDDKNICIDFYDNGTGIKEGLLSKIFENRFTTKESSGGSGVGLAMARLIIEDKMQGKIVAQNHEGGACFKITLPLVKKRP